MNRRWCTVMVLGAGVLWGLIVLFVRGLNACGLSSLSIVCYRNILSALLFGAFLLLRNPKLLRVSWKDLWMFLGTGVISVALFNLCYFITLMHTSVAVAALLLYTSPVFVTLMAFLFFHERMTKGKGLSLLLTVVGCACITGVFSQAQAVPLPFVLTGLGAGLFYGMYSIFGKVALKKYTTVTITFYTFLFAGLVTLPFSAANCVEVITVQPVHVLAYGVGLALFCTIAPFLLYTYGLLGIPAGRAAIFATTEPLVGTAVGILVFGDQMTFWTVLGIVLMLVAIWMANQPEKIPSPGTERRNC